MARPESWLSLRALHVPALFAWCLLSPHVAGAEPISGLGYYEDSAVKNCANVSVCSISFAPIPDPEFILSEFKCSINTTTGNLASTRIVSLIVSGNGHNTHLVNEMAPTEGRDRQPMKHMVVRTLSKVFTKEQKPTLRFAFGSATTISMNCNMLGRNG